MLLFLSLSFAYMWMLGILCLSVVRQDVRLYVVKAHWSLLPTYLYHRLPTSTIDTYTTYGAMGELAIDFGIINADNVEQVRLQRFNLIISC